MADISILNRLINGIQRNVNYRSFMREKIN